MAVIVPPRRRSQLDIRQVTVVPGLFAFAVPLFNQGSRTLTIPTGQPGRASLPLPSTDGVIEVEIPSAYISVAGSNTLDLSESSLSDGITLLVINDCEWGCTLRLELNGDGSSESEATVRYLARDSEYVDTLDAFVELD